MKFVDRVAEQAPKVKSSRALLSILAFPFYVLGLLAGLLLVAVVFAWGAIKLGLADARDHLDRNDGVPRDAD